MSPMGSNPPLGRYPRHFRLAIASGIRRAMARHLSRANSSHWPTIRSFTIHRTSLDHLVGERDKVSWNLDADRLCGAEVDHEFVTRGLLEGQF